MYRQFNSGNEYIIISLGTIRPITANIIYIYHNIIFTLNDVLLLFYLIVFFLKLIILIL